MKLSAGHISALKCLFKIADAKSTFAERCTSINNILDRCFAFRSPSELNVTRKIEPNRNLSSSEFIALVERMLGIIPRDCHLSFTANIVCLLEEKCLLQPDSEESLAIQNISKEIFGRILHLKKAHYIEEMEVLHNKQCVDYQEEWDRFEAEFEKNAKISIRALSKRQRSALELERKRIEIDFNSRPPVRSLQLKEFREREKILAYKEQYTEAQRAKVISDSLEEEEQIKKQKESYKNRSRKEKTYVQQQKVEMAGLVKRVAAQRDVNRVKREQDYERLLKRNKNIRVSLRMKYTPDIQQHAQQPLHRNYCSAVKIRDIC